MGVSRDGILCYGFEIHNKDGEQYYGEVPEWLKLSDDEDEEMDFLDFLENLLGLQEPDTSDPAYDQAQSAYWDRKMNLAKEVGVTLVRHSADYDPLFILAVTDCCHVCNFGDTISFGQGIEVRPEWREMLVAFCNRAGIEFREPELLLCSFTD